MAKVILVRHPETALNKKNHGASSERIRGWVDVPLDDKGKREALALAAQFGSRPIKIVYSSDLQRAVDAALPIARTAKVPHIATKDLRPWNLGVLHGKEVDKVLPLMNKCVEKPDVVIPKGESFNDFRVRYLTRLKAVLDEARASDKDIIVLTHSRNIQLARAWDKKGRPDDLSFDTARMLDYKDEVQPGGEIILEP